MKKSAVIFLVVVMAGLLLMGCGKQPTEDINAAKSAVDTVIAEGAEKYASEDAKLLNDELTAALDEIKIQDGKMMKNYGKAQEMLAKVKADAETLKSSLPMKKEEAKNNALVAQEAAKTAIEEARNLLSKAPKGKGSRADIEAMKADVKGLEDSLVDVQVAVNAEDYATATEKARSIQEKAAEVSSQVTQAMEKVGAKTQ
jgi:methyl-accepting chemotaxis protein